MSEDRPPASIGRFRIVSLIGRGRAGEVYLAQDSESREVALRVVDRGIDPTARARMEREARIALGIDHPNVARTFEVGTEADRLFVGSELLRGSSLADRIARHGHLAESEALSVFADLLAALDAVGRAGLVHRDVRPANVLFDTNGTAKLTDVGLAPTRPDARSIPYAAPELLEGTADPRCDLYSAGVLLYECLTGKLPRRDASLPDVRDDSPSIRPELAALIRELVARREERPAAPSGVRARVLALRVAPPESASFPSTIRESAEAPKPSFPKTLDERAKGLADMVTRDPGGPAAASARPAVVSPTVPELAREVEEARADRARRFGSFVLLSELGRGGMGAVYRAWDERLGRLVAVKTVLEGSAPRTIKRFHREAEALARLKHPNIVTVHEVGETAGKHWLVMDLVEGKTLASRLARIEGEPPLLLAKALEAIRDTARAVQYAHEQRVVHRDLKPGNIMLDAQDHPHVLDFGLARVRDAAARITHAGAALGTPAYMSPEQAAGSGDTADERSDVYSLGATLYHVLTGRAPFDGETALHVLAAVSKEEPVPPSAIDRRAAGDLDTICLKCLEKAPERRYATAGELADELDRHLRGEPIRARPTGAAERSWRWVRRNRFRICLGLLVGALAVTVGAFWVRDALTRSRNRQVVSTVLSQLRSGDAARTAEARDETVSRLVRAGDAQTVLLLGAALDGVTNQLAGEEKRLRPEDERLASVLCEALWRIGRREGAVEPLVRYLDGADEDHQNRACDAGLALCQLGGDDALLHVLDARDRLGIDGEFWRTIKQSPFAAALSELASGGELRTAREYARRAETRRAAGDLSGVIADYTSALKLEPANAGLYVNRALARSASSDPDGAIADLTSAITLAPRETRAHANRATVRRQKGDLDGAIADCTSALAIDPCCSLAYDVRACVLTEKGDLKGANADATRAIELAPRNAVARLNRGVVRKRLGDLEGALDDLSQAIALDEKLAEAWANRAGVCLENAEPDRAISDATRAIELAPRLAGGYVNRGFGYQDKGALDDAISDLTRALELDSKLAFVWDARGQCRMDKGDFEGAITDFREAMKIDPQVASFWSDAADVSARAGKAAEATVFNMRARALEKAHAVHAKQNPRATLSQAAFEALFLAAPDLPGLRLREDYRSGLEREEAFISQGGEQSGSVIWIAEESDAALGRVCDFRWVFPSARAAKRYQKAMLRRNAEGEPEVKGAALRGDEGHVFGGLHKFRLPNGSEDAFTCYICLFRVGCVVVKLYVAEGPLASGKLKLEAVQPLANRVVAILNERISQQPSSGPSQPR